MAILKPMTCHPWLKKYPINSDVRHLIIGTHPPMPYSGPMHYYYGNKQHFWRLLDQVYPGQGIFSDRAGAKLEKILPLLEKLNMGITDMVEGTDGSPFSTDAAMKWTKLNSELWSVLTKGSVEKVYFTSLGGINSAIELFRIWLDRCMKIDPKVVIPSNRMWRNDGLKIQLDGKPLHLEVLFSPSQNGARNAKKIPEYQYWLNNHPSGTFDDFRVDWYKRKLPPL